MMGVDPEFFILNSAGKPIPAWKHFPPKEAKIPYGYGGGSGGTSPHGWYFRDGYALEFNTPPETCRARMGNSLRQTVGDALEKLPKGSTLSTAATIRINNTDMKDAPQDCQIFGCDPSYNAYTEKLFTVDLDAMTHPFRYAGGHMHYGAGIDASFMKTSEASFMFVKLCDLFIGLPFAFLYATKDERLRRKYYGRAGECRLQKYPNGGQGVEYRVPSPKLWNNHSVATLFFGVMRTIHNNYADLAKLYDPKWEQPVQDAINNCDVPQSMLQTVPGMYTPELLISLKKQRHFRIFEFPTYAGDCHTAFTEHVRTQWPRDWANLTQYSTVNYAPMGQMTITPVVT